MLSILLMNALKELKTHDSQLFMKYANHNRRDDYTKQLCVVINILCTEMFHLNLIF